MARDNQAVPAGERPQLTEQEVGGQGVVHQGWVMQLACCLQPAECNAVDDSQRGSCILAALAEPH